MYQVVCTDQASQQERWERRCHVICKRLHCFRWKFFGSLETHHSSVKAAASVLACVFHGSPDLVLSDILAGYILLTIVQSHENHSGVLPINEKAMETPDAVCVENVMTNTSGVTDCDDPITISISATLDTCSNLETVSGIILPTNMPGDITDARALELRVEELAYYSRYAIGAYGWLLYIYTYPWKGIFYLLGSYYLQRRHTSIFGDNWLRLNQSALYLASGITSQDLLYASFRGTVSHPAFYVGHDHDKREVVVAIRGTLSLEDCLTDAMAQHMSMDAIATQLGCDGFGEFAHEGFLQAAHTIYLEIERLQLLKTLYTSRSTHTEGSESAGYRLVIVGHSLGAATASLLAVMLKPKYPDLRCFCYSPPGCTMSAGLSDRCKDYITSVVLGHDVVASASVQAAEEFRDRILEVIERSKVSKAAILRRTFSSRKIEDLLHDSSNDTGRESAFVDHLTRYRESLKQVRATQMLYELMMPGRLIHLKHKDAEDYRGTDTNCSRRRCRNLARKFEYDFEWTHHTKFRSIRIARSMLDDHLASNVHAVLQNCVKRRSQRPT